MAKATPEERKSDLDRIVPDDDRLYTLSEVAAAIGANRRSLQIWTDAGVLHPEPGTNRAGTGIHRKYRYPEIEIAAICAEAQKFGAGIGMLLAISERWRKRIVDSLLGELPDGFELPKDEPAEAWVYWKLAREGRYMLYLTATPIGDNIAVGHIDDGSSLTTEYVEDSGGLSWLDMKSFIVFNITRIFEGIRAP